MGQRRGPRGTSSVPGKGFGDRYTMSNIAKMDREGGKGGQVGYKRVQEGPKGWKRGLRWVTVLPRTTGTLYIVLRSPKALKDYSCTV